MHIYSRLLFSRVSQYDTDVFSSTLKSPGFFSGIRETLQMMSMLHKYNITYLNRFAHLSSLVDINDSIAILSRPKKMSLMLTNLLAVLTTIIFLQPSIGYVFVSPCKTAFDHQPVSPPRGTRERGMFEQFGS